MLKQIVALTALLPLLACAGPVESRLGATGQALPKGVTVALATMPALAKDGEQARPDADYAARSAGALAAVTAALRHHGIEVDAKATRTIEVSFATRPAAAGASLGDGGALSQPTHRWAMQSCHHTISRLVVAYAQTEPKVAAGRGFAEESRCHAASAILLPKLADQAVAALLGDTEG